jgi:acyl carrier protein
MSNETVEIGPRIQQYIETHFPLARKQSIVADGSLLESGVIDSLGVLDLIKFLEEEFKIMVCDEDLRPDNFETITTMVAFVQSKNNGQNTP